VSQSVRHCVWVTVCSWRQQGVIRDTVRAMTVVIERIIVNSLVTPPTERVGDWDQRRI